MPGTRPWKGACDVRRTMWGAATALVALAACTAVLLAFRPQLSVATSALVLVVPVLLGVTVGGFGVGAGAAILGFLAYDWFFVRPYGTLSVTSAQDWVALGVYLAVVLVVSRLVAVQQDARRVAVRPGGRRPAAVRRVRAPDRRALARRAAHPRRHDRPRDVPDHVGRGAAARRGALEIAATAGRALDRRRPRRGARPLAARRRRSPSWARGDGEPRRAHRAPAPGRPARGGGRDTRRLRAAAAGHVREPGGPRDRAHPAPRARRCAAELLEEVDRWRSALVGAVSHDLRTPLASIKAAVSTLRGEVALIGRSRIATCCSTTIEHQCDRLTAARRATCSTWRGSRPGPSRCAASRRPSARWSTPRSRLRATPCDGHTVDVRVGDDLPLVEVDVVLHRPGAREPAHRTPPSTPRTRSTITVAAREVGRDVVLTVSDQGPGVPEQDRERIFHMLDRNAGSGRAGLGLAISTAFVEAHGAAARGRRRPRRRGEASRSGCRSRRSTRCTA